MNKLIILIVAILVGFGCTKSTEVDNHIQAMSTIENEFPILEKCLIVTHVVQNMYPLAIDIGSKVCIWNIPYPNQFISKKVTVDGNGHAVALWEVGNISAFIGAPYYDETVLGYTQNEVYFNSVHAVQINKRFYLDFIKEVDFSVYDTVRVHAIYKEPSAPKLNNYEF